MEKKDLKVLDLIIKQEYFDAIISGEKTQETREVKPTTIKKLLELDEEGFEVEDKDGNSIPIKYDALQLFVGYRKDRDTALVEVKDAYTVVYLDEDGQPIIMLEEEDEQGNEGTWVLQDVVYELGRVLSKQCKPKKKKSISDSHPSLMTNDAIFNR